jgi:hypothetical protein
VCDLYKSVIAVPSDKTPQSISIPKVLKCFQTTRITVRNAFQQLEMLALSPSSLRDRQDWFPAFLSACIVAISAIIFLDLLVVFPSPYREQIWGTEWHDRVVEMRNGGYGFLLGLMRANSMGVHPLKMDCWAEDSNHFVNVTPDSFPLGSGPSQSKRKKVKYAKSAELEAGRERHILLGMNSPAALQGVLALKAWHVKYNDHLKQGEDMFSKSLYHLATMKPVGLLWRIFELQ